MCVGFIGEVLFLCAGVRFYHSRFEKRFEIEILSTALLGILLSSTNNILP